MARRIPLITAFTLVLLSVAARGEGFIRVDEDASAARLQTAVTRYERNGSSVELIGAVHIADKAYYQKLSARFATYDSLLFEMIGGEKYAAAKPPAPAPAAPVKKEKDLSGLHQIYHTIARFLALTAQSDAIDYTTKNFVHADLTNAEFNQLQADRHESLLGFALKAGKPDVEAPDQPDPAKLLQAILAGNSNLVKLQIVHTLGHGDDQIAAIAGESVIITDRNQRCLAVMNRELAAGHQHLGIFYGAAHFPDMVKHLLELGYKRTHQEWLTAWDIPKPALELKEAS